MGLNDFLKKLFGNKSQRDVKEIEPYIKKIKAISPELQKISNDELRTRIDNVKEQLQSCIAAENARIKELKAQIEETEYDLRAPLWEEVDKLEKEIIKKQNVCLDEVLPLVFAVVKETAQRFTSNNELIVTATQFDRDLATVHDFVRIEDDKAIYQNHWMAGGNEVTWNMVHYDVQLIGGVVLHKGKIAEMATGEGKTLVATLPVFLNALTRRGVHVVTVNDYLSKRDSEWMGPLYMFHGLSVDCIDKHQPNSAARRKAYEADITFGTNNEFGFDYLRDNMAGRPEDLVQRQHNYAIVDEVDSVLIDDARTPLIISGPTPKGDDQMFEEFCPKVEELVKAQRTMVTRMLAEAKEKIASNDKKTKEEGAILLFRCFKGLPKNSALIRYLSEPGIKALLLETEAIYMEQNNRRMPEITDELYFVIDEKNNSIDLTDKGIDAMTGKSTDPNFFVLPNISEQLALLENENISGEEKQNKKDQYLQDYAIKAERVHTVHQLLKAYTLFDLNDQYVVIDNKVKIVDEQTGRIMEGRRYSDGLHQAIEAKEHVKVEAATQTFATITLQNYFRMYNKLSGMTGTAETEAGEFWDIYKLDVVTIPTNKPIARIDMNDRVYKTKRAKYNAIIEEIVAMSEKGRPVLVGTTSVEISELLSRMLSQRKIMHNVLNAKKHQQEADIVAHAGEKGTVTIATNMAGRGTDIKLTPEVREAGGLAIIGTERHESRRVDRQLRGRSGRQGDVGSSVFFVSFEDTVMRLFTNDNVVKMLDRLGFKEDEMIEHKMVTNSIENAQRRVEENNFGIRKRLLEYDDVMNTQRSVIYTKRHHALMGERIGIDILDTFHDTIESLISEYDAPTDYDDLSLEVFKVFAIEMPAKAEAFYAMRKQERVEELYKAVVEAFKRKGDRMAEIAHLNIKPFVEQRNLQGGIIRVPITDGKRVYGIPCDLQEAYESESRSVVKNFQKAVMLMTIDEAWKEHLRELDQLRQSVQNASYEQKDPLLIYKLESFKLFESMLYNMNRKAIALLMRGQIHVQEPQDMHQAQPERRQAPQYRESKEQYPGANSMEAARQASAHQTPQPRTPIIAAPKVGRNDPCPCGSGKKFKNCHGREQ
ncbi:MAG: preprotein translocase subunit SecA [Bacteroidaceae bacterium]|nr:preprotein translocase subunit SecA [Bacteroidaceae bacterium]